MWHNIIVSLHTLNGIGYSPVCCILARASHLWPTPGSHSGRSRVLIGRTNGGADWASARVWARRSGCAFVKAAMALLVRLIRACTSMLGSLKRPLVSRSTLSRSFISFEKPFAGIRGARMCSMSRKRMAALLTQSLTISSQSTLRQWCCLKAKAAGSPSTMSTSTLWFFGASEMRCSSLKSVRKGVTPHFSLR